MERRKIVFATGNRGKLREASEILGEGFELFTPMDFGLTDDIPETGTTLEENSLQKARFIFDRKGCDCFADDTGLEVEALGGAPGVYTARYAGEGKDFGKNMDKVLSELEALEAQDPKTTRRARFRSVVTLILDGEVHQFEGTFARDVFGFDLDHDAGVGPSGVAGGVGHPVEDNGAFFGGGGHEDASGAHAEGKHATAVNLLDEGILRSRHERLIFAVIPDLVDKPLGMLDPHAEGEAFRLERPAVAFEYLVDVPRGMAGR